MQKTSEVGRPPYELWIAFGVTLVPQLTALAGGGYGQVITNAPVAAALTIVDAAAVVIAGLQLREDVGAGRSPHWLVWATVVVGAIWLVYAVLVGVVLILGNLFCVSQLCRGPLR